MENNLFINNDVVKTYTKLQSENLVKQLISTEEFKLLEEYLLNLKNLSSNAIYNLSNNLQFDKTKKILYRDIWFGIYGIHKYKNYQNDNDFQYRRDNDFGNNLHIQISKYEKFELKLRFWKPMPINPIESCVEYHSLDYEIRLACGNGIEKYFLNITNYYDMENEKWHDEFYHIFTWETNK